MSTYVFDPEVFSFMFDITDVTPSVRKVSVEEVYRKAASGSSIPITVYIQNNVTTPGRSFLMNPTTGPSITIYGPSDTVVVSDIDMEQVELGIYTYVYDTSPSQPTGTYAAVFRALNAEKEMISEKYYIFTLT